MLTTRVLDPAMIESQEWVDAILALDRENMSSILNSAGLDFPEEKRISNLLDPSNVLIALLDDGMLAGYVDFRNDWQCDEGVNPADPLAAGSKSATFQKGVLRALLES